MDVPGDYKTSCVYGLGYSSNSYDLEAFKFLPHPASHYPNTLQVWGDGDQ